MRGAKDRLSARDAQSASPRAKKLRFYWMIAAHGAEQSHVGAEIVQKSVTRKCGYEKFWRAAGA